MVWKIKPEGAGVCYYIAPNPTAHQKERPANRKRAPLNRIVGAINANQNAIMDTKRSAYVRRNEQYNAFKLDNSENTMLNPNIWIKVLIIKQSQSVNVEKSEGGGIRTACCAIVNTCDFI